MKNRYFTKVFIFLIIFSTLGFSVSAQRFGGGTGSSSSSSKASLTVECNIRGARVEISSIYYKDDDRPRFTGTAPFTAQLDKGDYTVIVSAPGYQSVSQNVVLSSSRTLNIQLGAEVQPQFLTVTSNVQGARVIIRGSSLSRQINGNTTFKSELEPGTYKVRVNAPGYYAMDKDVRFSRSTTVDFQLNPKIAQLEIVIPNEILDHTKANPAGRIRIFDNGSQVNGSLFELNPGQHTIRVVSGGLASQQTINVRAGESYRIELDFGFSLIKE